MNGSIPTACSSPGRLQVNRLRGSYSEVRERDEEANVGERMIEANGVELCTEPFGDPGDPPVLLVMGAGGSMLWWEAGFCRLLAEGGRFVIRYDHRDTGRSVTCEPGRPRYSGSDLVADAVGVLDGYELVAAHVVGVSARRSIRADLVDRGANARHPRHRRPDVPTRARPGAGRRDPSSETVDTRGSRPRSRPSRLGADRPRDPRTHRRRRSWCVTIV